ncbi:hypothetical protein [Streptomyces sp. NPDC012510]|uniref:hypothetical protein n=1 Tax=Streptomyces sp. NPDC012510 TaxID=3364838 RepID=UPI0036EC0BAB
MSVAPPSSDVGPIVRRAFARTEALAVLARGGGRDGGVHSRRAGSHHHAPEPTHRFAAAPGINPAPLPLRHDQRFVWLESDGCHRLRAHPPAARAPTTSAH